MARFRTPKVRPKKPKITPKFAPEAVGSMQNVFRAANPTFPAAKHAQKISPMAKLGSMFSAGKKGPEMQHGGWSSLKRGVYTMARMAGATEDQLRYISSLTNEELTRFNKWNLVNFDEYFAYESHGIHMRKGDGTKYADLTSANQAEIQRFIDATASYRA